MLILCCHLFFNFVDDGVVEFAEWDTRLFHSNLSCRNAHCCHPGLVDQPGQTTDLMFFADVFAIRKVSFHIFELDVIEWFTWWVVRNRDFNRCAWFAELG